MQGFSQKYSPCRNRNSRTFCYMSLTVFRNARLRNFMEGVDNPEQSPQETRSGADGMAPLYSLVDSYAPTRNLCASWFPRTLLLGSPSPLGVTSKHLEEGMEEIL